MYYPGAAACRCRCVRAAISWTAYIVVPVRDAAGNGAAGWVRLPDILHQQISKSKYTILLPEFVLFFRSKKITMGKKTTPQWIKKK